MEVQIATSAAPTPLPPLGSHAREEVGQHAAIEKLVAEEHELIEHRQQ